MDTSMQATRIGTVDILPPEKPGLLINRNFALLWVGQAVSFTGDFLFDTILVLWVATDIARGEVWAPLAVSGVLLAGALPWIAVAPFTGVFVDSWNDKRKTMLWLYALSIGFVLLLLPLAGLLPWPFGNSGQLPVFWRLGVVYAATLLVGTLTQFFNSAEVALLGDIVEEPYRMRATGLHTLMINLAALLGPSLGALLYFALGVQWALLFNALSFGVAMLAIMAIRMPGKVGKEAEDGAEKKQANFWQELQAGLHFFAASRVLRVLLITGVLLEFGNSVRNTLGVFFLVQNLHAPASLYGLLGTAYGGGLMLGAVLTNIVAKRIGLARTYWLAATGWGILMIVYARSTSIGPAVAVLFVQGGINGATEVIMISLVLQIASQKFVGRVLAVFTPMNGLAQILAAGLAGYLVSTVLQGFSVMVSGMRFGPLDTIFMVVGGIGIGAGLYATWALRDVELEAKREEVEEKTVL
ncbi:MAG: MFS transporter [Ktedonobacteraceae bacterium]